jgi:hypothetical protein
VSATSVRPRPSTVLRLLLAAVIAAARYAHGTILDWDPIARAHPGWFVPDGLHMRRPHRLRQPPPRRRPGELLSRTASVRPGPPRRRARAQPGSPSLTGR